MSTYKPNIFSVNNIQEAKNIILTSEKHTTTNERWIKETPILVEEIIKRLSLNEESIVLDYGCGIGRLSKGIIDAVGCKVIGVDISPHMLKLAKENVNSNKFIGVTPVEFDELLENGYWVDCAISIWVLQHCLTPQDDITRIFRALRKDGILYILNNILRVVPINTGWLNDGIDIRIILQRLFNLKNGGSPVIGITSEFMRQHSYFGIYMKK